MITEKKLLQIEEENHKKAKRESLRQQRLYKKLEIELVKLIRLYEDKEKYNELLTVKETEDLKWLIQDLKEQIVDIEENGYLKRLLRELETILEKTRISRRLALESESLLVLMWYSYEMKNGLETHLKATVNNISNSLNEEKIVTTKWYDNKNFVDRVFDNIRDIEKAIKQKVEIEKLRKILKSKKNIVDTLVHTESSAIFNESLLEMYKQEGVNKVELIATLDSRTSRICRHKDGLIIDLEDADIGLELPPFHPHCRTIFKPVGNS